MTALKTSFPPAAEAGHRLRVLLVDDTPQVLRDLRVLLELTGEVEVVGQAEDGAAAVKLAAELAPEAVIMDLEMPGMDGYQATRRIKAQAPAMRVIILSVHAGPEERNQARAAGANGFVVKGASYEVLVDAICGKGGFSDGLDQKKGKQE